LLEAGLIGLHFDAVDNGYLPAEATNNKLRARYQRTCQLLKSQSGHSARRLEVWFVLGTYRDGLLNSYEDSVQIFTELVSRLQKGSIEHTKALQRYSLELAARDPAAAVSQLTKCMNSYRQGGNSIGEACIDYLNFAIDPVSRDKVERYQALAETFLTLKHFSMFWTSAYKAICAAYGRPDHRNVFNHLRNMAEPILQSTDNASELQELEICLCSCLASAQPQKMQDLEAAMNGAGILIRNPDLTPKHEADAYTILQQCCQHLNRVDEAVANAEKAFNCNFSMRHYPRRSGELRHLALNRHKQIVQPLNRLMTLQTEREQIFSRQYNLLVEQIHELEEFAAVDAEKKLPYLRQEKAEVLVQYYNTIILRYPKHKAEAVMKRRLWFRDLENGPANTQIRALAAMMQSLDGVGSEIEIADANLQQTRQQEIFPSMRLAESQLLCAVARRTKADLDSVSMTSPEYFVLLDEIISFLDESFATLQECDESHTLLVRATKPFLNTMYDIIRTQPQRYAECLTEAEQFLITSQYAIEHSRGAYATKKGLDVFLQTRQDEANIFRREFFRHAADFYLKLRKPFEAWQWNERGRGRALIAMLFKSAPVVSTKISIVPTSRIQQMPSPKSLAQSESIIELQRILDRKTQNKLQAPVYHEPHVDQVLLDEIFSFSKFLSSGTRIIIVDWYISPDGTLTMLSSNSETRIVQAQVLNIKMDSIRKWIERFLENPRKQLNYDPGALRELGELLSGLETRSQEGDLIILTPVFPLSLLPLHGIPIGMESTLLIERNPVVYNASATLTRQCLERFRDTSRSLESLSTIEFTAVYEGEVNEKERNQVYGLSKDTTALLGSERVTTGMNLTREKFEELLQTSPWVHFHGHANFTKNEPLKQAYILNKETSDALGQVEQDLFTAADIIRLNMQETSPFICSIACESGKQDIAPGDEPLGLISAMFVAGAASALGTLWPIRSAAGREFSRWLYEDVKEQLDKAREGQGSMCINLAEAARKAILGLKSSKDERGIKYDRPNIWAPFVLQGSPFIKFF
jgi:CHAT domain-containing protein